MSGYAGGEGWGKYLIYFPWTLAKKESKTSIRQADGSGLRTSKALSKLNMVFKCVLRTSVTLSHSHTRIGTCSHFVSGLLRTRSVGFPNTISGGSTKIQPQGIKPNYKIAPVSQRPALKAYRGCRGNYPHILKLIPPYFLSSTLSQLHKSYRANNCGLWIVKVKMKLPLCLTKHHATNTYRRV